MISWETCIKAGQMRQTPSVHVLNAAACERTNLSFNVIENMML